MMGSVNAPNVCHFSIKPSHRNKKKANNKNGASSKKEFVPLVDMSIPMEKLPTAADRYNRILSLQNKPYQLGTTEINRYFKLCKEEEDFSHLQELLTYLDKEDVVLKSNVIHNLVKTLLTFKTPGEVFQLMHKNNRVLKNCDKNTYTLLMNTAAELGDFKRVTRVAHYSYGNWKDDSSYLEHAVDLLLSSKHLGTAFTLIRSFDSSYAPIRADLMERMLNEAIEAKDRFRAEGLYMMLKDCWKIDKPYEIVGEREKPWLKEKKEEAPKEENEASKKEEAPKEEAPKEEAPKKKEAPKEETPKKEKKDKAHEKKEEHSKQKEKHVEKEESHKKEKEGHKKEKSSEKKEEASQKKE